MTKQKEIEALHRFINSLPADSYLSQILEGVGEYVEGLITSDYCFNIVSHLHDRVNRIQELEADTRRLELEQARLVKSVHQLQAQYDMASGKIRDLANDVIRVATPLTKV